MDLSDSFKTRIDALPEEIRHQCITKFNKGGYLKRACNVRFSNNQIIEMFEVMAKLGLKDQTAFFHAAHASYINASKKIN